MSEMNRRLIYHNTRFFIITILLVTSNLLFAQRNQDRVDYIEKFKDIAIGEMERAGIPASIKLAQAILESNAGKSVLARKANNHFGMKCGGSWEGKTYYREDDDYDEQGNLMKSCFRVYRNAEASFIAHSEFLRDPRKDYRYGFLFRIDGPDYRRWALGLKKAGYATNPNYPDLLIGIIEDYELYIYDNMDPNSITPTPPDILPSDTYDIVLVNDIKTALAKEGEIVAELAERANVPLKRILKYNEGLEATSSLEDGYRVFLQPKRAGFRGQKKYHYVKKGDNMMYLSQLYGVKLENLYKRNRIPLGREVRIGERVKLRGWKVAKANTPKTRSAKEQEEDIPPATIPVRDLDQDPELDFDTTIPSTSIEDFEIPEKENTSEEDIEASVDEEEEEDFFFDNEADDPVIINDIPEEEEEQYPEDIVKEDTPTKPFEEDTRARYYNVKDGDTLYRLSKRFNTTVVRLKELNGLTSNLIIVGQELRIR